MKMAVLDSLCPVTLPSLGSWLSLQHQTWTLPSIWTCLKSTNVAICYHQDVSSMTVPWGILARLFFVVINRVLQLSRAVDCFSPLEAGYHLLTLWELVPSKMVSRSPPSQPPCVEGLVANLWLCCGAVGLEPFIFSLFSIHWKEKSFILLYAPHHCILLHHVPKGIM